MPFLLRITLACGLNCLFFSLQAVTLTVEVDMSQVIADGDFDPATEFVDIAGSFNDWGTTLTQLSDPEGDGVWQVVLGGLSAGQSIEFKFRINGTWSGREEFPGVGNNRSLSVPEEDATLRYVYNERTAGPSLSDSLRDVAELDWWNDAVFYEVFVRSFYDSDGDGIGDFEGLTQKLDYLNDGDPATDTDLGIDAIWLMPINPSPSYHGYDVRDYRGINPDYGTMADFRAFLGAAHARGIRVIIDYVMNHSSNQHPWFANSLTGQGATYRDWYRWRNTPPTYTGPWGQAVWHPANGTYYYGLFWGGMPDLNYETPAVKQEMFDIASYWLNDVGVDGFRVDAVKHIFENGNALEDQPATFDFFADFRAHYKAQNPNAMAVGEAWTSTDNVVSYVENDRLDFCFEFDLAGTLIYAVNSGDVAALAYQIQRSYDAYPYLQWGSFLTNHDQNRVFEQLGNDIDRNKAAAGLYLTLPGVPFLYYGEEVGMLGSKPDEDIRRPMQWTSGAQGGFSSGTPWRALNANYPSYNVADQQATSGSLWRHYRDLIAVRHRSDALRKGYYHQAESDAEEVMAFLRYWNEDTVLVLVNCGASQTGTLTTTLPSGFVGNANLYDLLAEQPITVALSAGGAMSLPGLGGYETRIYAFGSNSVGIRQPTTDVPLRVYPNPAQNTLSLSWQETPQTAATYQLVDLQGRIVQKGTLPLTATQQIVLPQIATGLYTIQVQVGHETYLQKIRIGQ